jgi:hypothetical protein
MKFGILIMLGLAMSLGQEDPPQSINYYLGEWGYAHGEASLPLKKSGGDFLVMPEAIGMDLAGQAKSREYILSANFLTDEFSLFLEAPPSFTVYSANAHLAAREIGWQEPPDVDLIDGYRIRIYDRPDRGIAPVFEDDSIPPGDTSYTYTMNADGVCFSDLASFNGAKESERSQMVMITRTQNRSQGDTNGDGVVDGKDFMDVLASFGSKPGMTGWNPGADTIAPFGLIDDSDLALVTSQLGWTSP